MARYLFSYHAYLSWLPDRPRGYVRRDEGELPPDPVMAWHYRDNAKEEPVQFDDAIQHILVDETLACQTFQHLMVYAIATDPTHLHVLAGWKDIRPWERVCRGLRTSLTRRLNRELGARTWFSEGSSHKQVRDQDHHDYLVATYLPDHRGWKWDPDHKIYR